MTTEWIGLPEAASIAPGLTASRLNRLRRESRFHPSLNVPPIRRLSDGEVIYDELSFRRWLESTVWWEWTSGPGGHLRTPPSATRTYCYQDANLTILRQRTYITEGDLVGLVPDLPRWRVQDLRFKGRGPRFLKPTPQTVVYIAEDVADWANGVSDYSDPISNSFEGPREPFTPIPRHMRYRSDESPPFGRASR